MKDGVNVNRVEKPKLWLILLNRTDNHSFLQTEPKPLFANRTPLISVCHASNN